MSAQSPPVFLSACELAEFPRRPARWRRFARGKSFVCRCPAHADDEPSLHLETRLTGGFSPAASPAALMSIPKARSCAPLLISALR